MVGDFSNADTTYKTIEGGYDGLLYAVGKAFKEPAREHDLRA